MVPGGGRVRSDVASTFWQWLLQTARDIAGRARLVFTITVLFPMLAAGCHFLGGPRYVATSSFTPEGGNDRGTLTQIAGFAAQLGFSLGGGGDIGDPVLFYVTLLASRDILAQAALTEYTYTVESGSPDTLRANLLSIYHVSGETAADSVRSATSRLARNARATSYRDAGIVRLSTEAPTRDLAIAINRRLLKLVSEYNLQRRQSRGRAEREFVEQRLGESQQELESAERELEQFLQGNRQIDDPALRLERDRLQRQVSFREQTFLQVAQAYEQARINEIRDTPVITVVEGPEATARRTGGLLVDLVVWTMFGFAVAVSIAVGQRSYKDYATTVGLEAGQLRALARTSIKHLVGWDRPVPTDDPKRLRDQPLDRTRTE